MEKSVDGYVRFEDFTYHHYHYRYGYPALKKSYFAKAIKRLREKGLVDFILKQLGFTKWQKSIWASKASRQIIFDRRIDV